MRVRFERGTWLVEADMAVRSDAENLEPDTACGANGCLVPRALGLDIGRGAVEKVDAPRIEVHVAEQVLLHELAIRAGLRGILSEELIQIERGRTAEVGSPGGSQLRELAVEEDGRSARRQPEHQRRIVGQAASDEVRQVARERAFVGKDADPHVRCTRAVGRRRALPPTRAARRQSRARL